MITVNPAAVRDCCSAAARIGSRPRSRYARRRVVFLLVAFAKYSLALAICASGFLVTSRSHTVKLRYAPLIDLGIVEFEYEPAVVPPAASKIDLKSNAH